ncbi:MAG: SDR family NAD(P)-dependent oxidoreductase [Ignavibacteria bacterium]|nr:SDR family NAD(P)-dependent oxidoreductase [Ignavibacteria bacterium]
MNIIIVGIGNIGFEVAKQINTENNKILLIARSMPEYASDFINTNSNVFFAKGDATKISDMESIRDSLASKGFGSVDFLIITPGLANNSTFLDDPEGFRQCFEFNYYCYVIPIQIFIGLISPEERGGLILLSATSGHHADTRLSGYPASKWSLENLFSSLREEVRDRNISVDVLAVRTIKNKYSKVWTQNYGESPEQIAKYLYNLVVNPKNKRHFIPSYFLYIRLIERLLPKLLDFKHNLRNASKRRKYFRNIVCDNVLITGAASGLGKALALTYAKTARQLYLCDINIEGLNSLKEDIKKQNSCLIDVFKVDVQNMEAITTFICNLNRVDLLINNVGVRFQGKVENTPMKDYKKNLDINLFSHLQFIYELFRRDIPPKKVINILSTTAIRGRNLHGLYSSAKAAMWNCTRSLRRANGSTYQIMEVIPSGMSDTKLVENSIVSSTYENVNSVCVHSKRRNFNLQSKIKFLKITKWSALDAAKIIQKYERKGKEILYIPPVQTKLFLTLETLSNSLFSFIFRR